MHRPFQPRRRTIVTAGLAAAGLAGIAPSG